MFSKRVLILAVCLCTASVFAACSNSSNGASPPTTQMQQVGSPRQVLSPHKRDLALETAPLLKSNSTAQCTLIDSVYPQSDFAGHGFTAAAVSGGNNLNIDATGCTYGIYLYPGAPDLHISNSVVRRASRFQIFAEAVPGVSIDHTVVSGTSLGKADPSSVSNGGIAFRGASGKVTYSRIYNGINVGMNIVDNNACFGATNGTCMPPNVTVTNTMVDNSQTTGDGFAVIGGPYPENQPVASISHTTVIGLNSAVLPGTSQLEMYGAQVGFATDAATIRLSYDSAVNDQVGFDIYCSNGISGPGDLKVQHDTVKYSRPISLPQSPFPENQVLNVFSADQLNAVFPGFC